MKYKLSFVIVICFLLPAVAFAQIPRLYSVTPDTGAQDNSYTILMSGLNFVTGATADFGTGISVTDVVFITTAFLRADIDISPTAPIGTRDVIVMNPGGEADTLVDGFYVVDDDIYPPEATLLFPDCGSYLSCGDTSIIVALSDEHSIDPASVEVEVAGTRYTLTDDELELIITSTETTLVFTPDPLFPEGEVRFRITSLADMLGNDITIPLINCSFWFDYTPPSVWDFHPDPGGTTREVYPRIAFRIGDTGSGLDTSSLVLNIGGREYPGDHPSVIWAPDSIVWSASMAGIFFSIGETVWVCIDSASDKIDICPANVLRDTCWFFSIYIPPPSDLNLSIRQIMPDNFPLVTSLVYVTDEDDRTIEALDARNFVAYEDGLRQYPLIVRSLGGGGMADIVFVIDDTGSMGWIITSVHERVGAFADSLARIGINYRLGLVTFKDDVDFDGTRYGLGYDLTADIVLFQTMVDDIVASGGGDGPEVSLDAICDALNMLNFRPGARRVIIMITDNSAHELGDGTAYSDVTLEGTVDSLLMYNAVCFVVSQDIHAIPQFDGPGSITVETGGTWYDLDYPFAEILEQIAEFIRGGYYISYTTSNSVADCAIRYVTYEAIYASLDDSDEGMYIAPCGPAGEIIIPQPAKITSDRNQVIMMDLNEPHEGINDSSIQFVVEEVLYSVITSAELSLNIDTLSFIPSTPFVHRQEVNVVLAQVLDFQGNNPFSGPIEWEFYVDLEGPEVTNPVPEPGSILDGPDRQNPIIEADITDDLAGVNGISIIVKIEAPLSGINMNYFIHSEGVTWDETTFTINSLDANLHFLERDTVCVTVLRADDQPDYGDPNHIEPTYQWCFYVADDDTNCPEFSNFTPEWHREDEDFYLECDIIDPSDVFDDNTGSEGYGVYLVWTPDGDLDDGNDNHEEQMYSIGGDRFQALIPGQPEDASFIYRVCAYDDDFDDDLSIDRSFCCSDTQRISFRNVTGPIATLIMPLNATWTTNENQVIKIHLVDDANGIDENTILLNIEGTGHTHDGITLIYDHDTDTLYYYPMPPDLFTDGQTVNCELAAADDSVGNELQETLVWEFYVDLTGPVGTIVSPPPGAATEDYQQDIILTLEDVWREVDTPTIRLIVDEDPYQLGDDGLYWDPGSHTLSFIPEDVPTIFADGESVCVTLEQADDIMPDYGDPNPLTEVLHWCFIPSLTFCNASPNVFTPNDDGWNDVVTFTYPHQVYGGGVLTIYTLDEEEVRTIEGEPASSIIWNGRNNSGNPVSRGIYIWIITYDDEIVCNGTVTLIR
ncbi:gliding motility-associated C-terminal domain-containing protein [bacterium]|nr:gliding motility-associated C-terminal domain-containing protein [bacterium]